jgi:hypothetical protein
VKEVAEGSVATAERLGEIFRADRARIENTRADAPGLACAYTKR